MLEYSPAVKRNELECIYGNMGRAQKMSLRGKSKMQNVIYSMTPFKNTHTHYSFLADRLHIWKHILKD